MRRRKWLALLLTVAMIATTLVTTGISSVFAADSGTYMYGDVNGDNQVNIQDVSEIIRHIQKKAVLSEGTTAYDAANVILDDAVNIKDVSEIVRLIQHKISKFDIDLDGDGYGPEGSVPHIATLEVSGEGGSATITNESTGTAAVASVAEAVDEAADDAEVETAAATVTQWTIEQYMKDHPESENWVDGGSTVEGVDNTCQSLMPIDEDGSPNQCSTQDGHGTVVFRNGDKIVDDENITVIPGYGTDRLNHWHYNFNQTLQMPCLQGTINPKTNAGGNMNFTEGAEPVKTGSFMVYIPKKTGTLYVRNLVFGNKDYGVVQIDGLQYDQATGMISNPGTVGDVLDKIHTEPDHPVSKSSAINVEEGAIYYCLASGSKIGIQGFTFVPNGATAPADDPNAKTTGEAAPEPTEEVEDPNFWKATEDVTTDTKEIGGALTFLEGMTFTSGSRTIDGASFAGYVTGTNGAGWSDGAATGAAIKFVAPDDGALTVYVRNVGGSDNEKTFVLMQEGAADTSEALDSFTGKSEDTAMKINVTKGTTYYGFSQGSKQRFCGVKFEAGGTVDPGETTAPTPTPDVNPTPTPDTPTPTPEETLPPLEDNQVRGVKGDKIVINSTPDAGYKVDTITVSDGTEVTFDKADKTVASFEMPSADVTVTVTFKLAGSDSYDAVLTAEGGDAELSGEGVTAVGAASVDTASWEDFPFVKVTTDDSGNTVYAINGEMTEGGAEVTIDAKATYGDANTMIFYNNNNNTNWKVGGVGYLLMKTSATIADTTDGLDAVVAVKVPYDSKLSVTTGGNGGHGEGLVYAQTGLGADSQAARKVIATIPAGKNEIATSIEDEEYAAKKDDVVYIYCTDIATKFRSVEFIPDSGTDPTPPTPTATTEPEPTATTEPEPAGKTYTVKEGSTVTVTGTPDEAHAGMSTVVKVTTEDGAPVEVSADNTFVMPPQNVNVSVTFEVVSNIPQDKIWRADSAAVKAALTPTLNSNMTTVAVEADGATVGPNLTYDAGKKPTYVHTDGKSYSFTMGLRGGSGGTTDKFISIVPEQGADLTVTVVFDGHGGEGREQNIVYGDKKETAKSVAGGASTVVMDLTKEDLAANPDQPIFTYGGGSNKNVYAIFLEYFVSEPEKTVKGSVTNNTGYDFAGKNIVFTNASDPSETYTTPYGATYSLSLPKGKTFNATIEGYDDVCTTLETKDITVSKNRYDQTVDITFVKIEELSVKGNVSMISSHDVLTPVYDYNPEVSTTLVFTNAEGEGSPVEAVVGTDGSYTVSLMSAETYNVSIKDENGYTLSPLSQTYTLEGGDQAPFKNILLMKDVGDSIEYKDTLTVGTDKDYPSISEALAAVRLMKGRTAGQVVTIAIDPGTYQEQLYVDVPDIALKAANSDNKPKITFYYGIGYIYYSVASSNGNGGYAGWYSADYAVQKTGRFGVNNWGATIRTTAKGFYMENIDVQNSYNLYITEQEVADGVIPGGGDAKTVQRTDTSTPVNNSTYNERAAAIFAGGSEIELYKCSFVSSQDTFGTGADSMYVKDCLISGNTDYICGGNNCYFENCELRWQGMTDKDNGGYITACKTSSATDLGYYLKDCKITKNPDSSMKAGGGGTWGRPWGGANTPTIYDHTIIANDVNKPNGWDSMSGASPQQARFSVINGVYKESDTEEATDLTAKNDNPSTTVLDPPDATDYFGLWMPKNYEGEVGELTEYTTVWQFGRGSGAADYSIEGAASSPIEIVGSTNGPAAQNLTVDATVGKFENTTRNDQWAQVNAGTKFTLPVVNGTVITFGSNTAEELAVDGYAFNKNASFTYYGDATTLELTVSAGGYLSYIQTKSPATPTAYDNTPHNVSIASVASEQGSVTTDPSGTAPMGKIVTITATPTETYKVKNGGISVQTASGNPVTLSGDKFQMPAEDVTVKVEFDEKVTEQPSNINYEMAFNSVGATVDGVKISSQGEYKLFDDFVTLVNMKSDNDHGIDGNGGSIKVQVPGKVKITVGTCAYDDFKLVITPDGGGDAITVDDIVGNAQGMSAGGMGTYKCYSAGDSQSYVEKTYEGGATTLTITFENSTNGANNGARFWLPYLRVQTVE